MSATPPDWDMVTFELKSWGEPLVSWRLTSQGGGSWTEAILGERPGQYILVWHEIEPATEQYAALERILRRLPAVAPDSSRCENLINDLPYGIIRLSRGATTTEIAFNSGCQDEAYQALLDPLKDANDLVGLWGKDAQVLRRENIREDASNP